MTIRAIIFDLGGVLLRTTDYSAREQLASRLGMKRNELEKFIFGRESGDQAQRGEITVQQHWTNLSEELSYSPEEFHGLLDEFFANDVLDFSLLEHIRELHKTYKTGLLSNAWDDLRQVIADKWHFEDAFDDIVISAEVGLAKPDRRIYKLATERLGVEPRQAVFVDDLQLNVDAANAAGLWGIHFLTPGKLRDDLELLLNGHAD